MTAYEEPTPEILTESGSSDYEYIFSAESETPVRKIRIDLDHRFDIDDPAPEETP